MRSMRRVAIAVAAAMLATVGAGAADAETITIANRTQGAIWITVYAGPFHTSKLDWFCVTRGQTVSRSKASFGSGMGLTIRAEVKRAPGDCGNPKHVFDFDGFPGLNPARGVRTMTFVSERIDTMPEVKAS